MMAVNRIGSFMGKSYILPNYILKGVIRTVSTHLHSPVQTTKTPILPGVIAAQQMLGFSVNPENNTVSGTSTADGNSDVCSIVQSFSALSVIDNHYVKDTVGIRYLRHSEKLTSENLRQLDLILPTRLPPIIQPPAPSNVPLSPDPLKPYRPSVPISCPVTEQQLPEIRATNRVKRQRRKHVVKKHKKQRLRKMRHIIMKEENAKEAAAEAKFRKEMSMLLKNGLDFDADKYVRDTIARSKWVPTPDNTEALKFGVHWSDFMTVEQLFGVPDGDYIDKKAGFPNDEDWAKILELREKYEKEYSRKK